MDINIYKEFEKLIKYALDRGLIEKTDVVYARNSLIELFDLDEYIETSINSEESDSLTSILNNILDYAFNKGILKHNSPVYRDLLDTKIMNIFMPRPSDVIKEFNGLYKESPIKATDYFYNLSKSCDYVRTDRIAQNMTWKSSTEYGDMDITINLSKPEKDPKAIAKAREMKSVSYPKCLLCKENVGYRGRVNHPARQNLRIIPITLNDEQWNIQYSPYSYYNEHCIVFADEHIPMKISKDTFNRVLDFIDEFPHYFIGSNADLPIVGGSILTHDHYQGGKYEFAMAKAPDDFSFVIDGFKDIECSIVKWPLTVVRLRGTDKKKMSDLSYKILNHWREYSDAAADVYAYSGNIPHNTITPVARKKDGKFELDLVLRNNRCSEEYPDGIFHPHKELHHIKKENIGLIEVLGLAVLPARLKEEISLIKDYILKSENSSDSKGLEIHMDWINEIKQKYSSISNENIDSIIKDEIGIVFKKVLEHCGVFKRDEMGEQSTKKYVNSLKKEIR